MCVADTFSIYNATEHEKQAPMLTTLFLIDAKTKETKQSKTIDKALNDYKIAPKICNLTVNL